MKKSKRKALNYKSNKTSKTATQTEDIGRRGVLAQLRNKAIGLVALGGAGAYFYSTYQVYIKEHDLTQVGQGKPTVVQVHDPSCSVCAALQKAARNALSEFEDDKYEFLVADITTQKGRLFSTKYRVPHITLLLFDRAGNLEQVHQGMKTSEQLRPIFRQFLRN